jgi:hypothetical protein
VANSEHGPLRADISNTLNELLDSSSTDTRVGRLETSMLISENDAVTFPKIIRSEEAVKPITLTPELGTESLRETAESGDGGIRLKDILAVPEDNGSPTALFMSPSVAATKLTPAAAVLWHRPAAQAPRKRFDIGIEIYPVG